MTASSTVDLFSAVFEKQGSELGQGSSGRRNIVDDKNSFAFDKCRIDNSECILQIQTSVVTVKEFLLLCFSHLYSAVCSDSDAELFTDYLYNELSLVISAEQVLSHRPYLRYRLHKALKREHLRGHRQHCRIYRFLAGILPERCPCYRQMRRCIRKRP